MDVFKTNVFFVTGNAKKKEKETLKALRFHFTALSIVADTNKSAKINPDDLLAYVR